jgi:UDP-glucose 4-epimerase
MSRYLITGGAGFIGSNIADALIERGHSVVVLDDLSTGSRDNLAQLGDAVELIEGDIRDAETCLRAAEGCDGIYHEAALVSVPHSIEAPRDNHDINITGTFNILEAARANGVGRIVFASSAAVYGDNPELPKREEMLPEPKSPYALAKLNGEHYLCNYADIFGIEAVALRYFNVFGPRQNPSSPYSGVISIFVDRVSKGLPVTIFGDGEQSRDFVNVADVVQANLLAMGVEAGIQKTGDASFHLFNVATNRQTNLLKLLETLEEICETRVERVFKEERGGDIKHSLADIGRTVAVLGYQPQVELKDGLAELVDYTLSN